MSQDQVDFNLRNLHTVSQFRKQMHYWSTNRGNKPFPNQACHSWYYVDVVSRMSWNNEKNMSSKQIKTNLNVQFSCTVKLKPAEILWIKQTTFVICININF